MGSIKTRFDAVAARKYTTSSGEEKTQWINLGRAVEWDDGGLEIELNSVPCGSWWNGKLKLFVQKPREQQGRSPQRPARHAAADDFKDDVIPF